MTEYTAIIAPGRGDYPLYEITIATPSTEPRDAVTLPAGATLDDPEEKILAGATKYVHRGGWELAGEWTQTSPTTWEALVTDRRTQQIIEMAHQIAEMAADPILANGPSLGTYLANVHAEMRRHVAEGKDWREQRRLKSIGAVTMPNGAQITRPGMVVWHDPKGWTRGISQEDWRARLHYYRVAEREGKVMVARIAGPHDQPDEDATWEVAADADRRLARAKGLFRDRGALQAMRRDTW